MLRICLENAKRETAAYVAKLKEMLGVQVNYLEKLDEAVGPIETPAPVYAAEGQQEAEKKAEEIEKSVAEFIENAVNAVEEEMAAEDVDDTKIFDFPEASENKKTKFEFFDLQFGDDVDVTK